MTESNQVNSERNVATDSLFAERALTIVLAVFLFAIPLAYSPGDDLFDDFYYAPKLKTGLFLLSVAGAFFIYLSVRKRIPPKFFRVHFVVLMFLAAMGLSVILSPHPQKAFWGRHFRSEGLLAFVLYGVAFFLFSWHSRSGENARKLIRVIIFSAIIASAYGLLQFGGGEILSRDRIRAGWWRAFATSGNPDFLSAFLLLVLPFPVLFYLCASDIQKKSKNLLWLVASAIIFSCILATYHRGAWVGLAAACLVAGVALWRKVQLRSLFKVKRVFILVAVFITCLLAISYYAEASGRPSILTRISSGVGTESIEESSIDVRTYIWRATCVLIMKRPAFGWGPDTMYDVFQKHAPKPVQLGYQGIMRTKPDKPENIFLQIAYEGGMVALVPFAVVIGLILLSLWRSLSGLDGNDRLIVFGVFLGITAYLAQQQFSFSTLSTSPIFWSLAGMGLAVSSYAESTKTKLR